MNRPAFGDHTDPFKSHDALQSDRHNSNSSKKRRKSNASEVRKYLRKQKAKLDARVHQASHNRLSMQ